MALSPVQHKFILWLLDPSKKKGTQQDFARSNGFDPALCSRWKKDAEFRLEWEKKHSEIASDMDRIQQLYDRLFELALNGDRLAIMNYLEVTGKYAPQKTLQIRDPRLAEASDEDILSEIKRMEQAVKKKKGKPGRPRKVDPFEAIASGG